MKIPVLPALLALELIVVSVLATALAAGPANAAAARCGNKPSGAEMGACQTSGQISVCYSNATHYCFYNGGGNCYTGECTGN